MDHWQNSEREETGPTQKVLHGSWNVVLAGDPFQLDQCELSLYQTNV